MGVVPELRRLYKVEVEVEFDPCTDHVLVWAESEEEAERIAEDDADDSFEPEGVASVRAQSADEMSETEIEQERKWQRRIVNGEGFTWEAALEAAQEEKRALELWAAQRVLPGMPPPPLPPRCEDCGARSPLTPHEKSCPKVTSPDTGGCHDALEGGSHT